MNISFRKVELADILDLRKAYLNELDCQIRYDACHVRNWSDEYLIYIDRKMIGYFSIKGKEDLLQRDAIFEIYVLPLWRRYIFGVYEEILKENAIQYLECQTNDGIHTPLLFTYGSAIKATTILFEDGDQTEVQIRNAIVRKRRDEDPVFEKNDGAGAIVLEVAGEVVASGGFLLHYNFPFADLYMETKSDRRRLGYATFLLQEIKKLCYREGRVPAARCRINNRASRATLLKAGMRVCGHMLSAKVS